MKGLINKKMLRQIDWLLLGMIIMLVIFSLISITSAVSTGYSEDELTFSEFIASLDFSYSELQIVYFAIGLVAIAVILLIDYNNLRDYSDILYWILVAMLVIVLLFGSSNRGTKGWFMIGSRGFQPAEVGKPILIIMLAKEFAKRTEGKTEGIRTFRELFPILWRFAIPFVLIMLQPDWGTAIVYAFIFIGMLFMAKTSLKLIGFMGLGVAGVAPLFWLVMADWQKERLLNFLDPTRDLEGTGYNVAQSKIVAQAGGVSGKGFFSSDLLTQRKGFLPEEHTDFIFASTAEAIGTIGGVILILFYFFLLFRMFMLASRAKDDFGALIIIGVLCMFLFHIFENIGMNIGLMPVTGIPLPLFSYGGSYMLTSLAAVGLVLNVNMRRLRYSP